MKIILSLTETVQFLHYVLALIVCFVLHEANWRIHRCEWRRKRSNEVMESSRYEEWVKEYIHIVFSFPYINCLSSFKTLIIDVQKHCCILFSNCLFSRFIADNQMSQASMLFVENCGPHIIRRNLCRNFLLHLVNLHDFNLVTIATIDRAMARMKEIEESLPELEEGQELPDATCNGHAVSSGVSLHGKRTKSGVSDWKQLVLQEKLWTESMSSDLNHLK